MTKDQQVILMEFTKSIGESIRKNEILAIVHSCTGQQYFPNSTGADSCQVKHKSIGHKYNDNSRNSDKSDTDAAPINQENIKRYIHKILSAIEITQERTYDKDPLFGVELLRSLAVKSAAIHDTDVVKSTVTGLFKILTYAVSNEEKFGRPFYIHSHQNENQSDELSPQENTNIDDPPTRIIFANPKEASLSDTVMNELSVICNMAADGRHLPIISHRFNNDLHSRFPQASRTLKIYMKNIIDEPNKPTSQKGN
jgi:hypothetical protein